ncbi:MAG TPA: DUF262 domain-containing HNH endonuclease family protein [Flavipsychrobacter sp.]|nr:DUF262 domain-containing HNH endonuclease family protein [Flavipsychrobacter sp.]
MATMNFNTANQTYRQIMGNGLIYTVPRFQRDYSWTEAEWDDLWNDILTITDGDAHAGHYMGFLVFQSRDSKNFDVIDGQQRLTTMSVLILAVLGHLNKLIEQNSDANNNQIRQEQLRNSFIGYLDPVTLIARTKLTLNRNNDTLYQHYMVPLEPLPKRNLKAPEHLMRKAYDWFYERLSKLVNVEEQKGVFLAKLVEQVADKLFFTVITVADELNAYKVFETLNARGVKLSSTDLLKNYLFSIVHTQAADERELNILDDKWEHLVGKLGSESFPDFLRTHWNSKNRFVRHAELFKRIREKVNNRQEVFDLVRNMERDADVYAALPSPEDSLWTPEQRKYVAELKLFGVRQLYPLLLAAYHKLQAVDFCTLLKVCSVITFRWNIIGSLSRSDQERIYTGVAEKITAGSLSNIREIVTELRSLYVKDEIFKSAFAEKEIKTTQTRNKRIVRYILAEIEKHLSGADYYFDSDTFNIEHILPENPADEWAEISDKEHEQLVYRLGNMTLLKTSENRDIGNKPFFKKKETYAQSEFATTKKIAEENSEWNAERLAARQRWMANQATSIWRINQLS